MQERRCRRAFTDTFKAGVVELCWNGDRTIPEVARDVDLTDSPVRRWVEQTEIDAGRKPGLTSNEHEELVRLFRREADEAPRSTASISLSRAAIGAGRAVSSLSLQFTRRR